MTVTRKEIADSLTQIGIGKKVSYEIVDHFFNLISDELQKEHEVRLVGFGKFYTTKKKETRIYNPTTREYKVIPERTVVKFTPSKSLKESMKNIDF